MSRSTDIPDEDAWTFDVDAGDYRIKLEGTAEFGTPHVTSIAVEGITRPDGKRIVVTREVLAEVARRLTVLADNGFAIHRATETKILGEGTLTLGEDTKAAVRAKDVRLTRTDYAYATETFEQLQSARRRRLTTDDLQRIAEAYKDAQADRRPVIAAVAEEMTVSKSRAAHLIKEARKAGLLPPAQPRGNSNAEDE